MFCEETENFKYFRVNLSSRRKPKLFIIKNLRNDVLAILSISRVLLRNFVLV
jgi:hypothetical protein